MQKGSKITGFNKPSEKDSPPEEKYKKTKSHRDVLNKNETPQEELVRTEGALVSRSRSSEDVVRRGSSELYAALENGYIVLNKKQEK